MILSGVEGSSSGFHGSIALVLLVPGQVHIMESSCIKVLVFLSPVGQIVQSCGNFFRNNTNLNNSGVSNEGIIDWESFSGVVACIGHNFLILGDIGLNNRSGSI
jgi:hypothetical protein